MEKQYIEIHEALDAIYAQKGVVDKSVIKRLLLQLPTADVEERTCEFWDTESNFCTLHRPSAQPEPRWISVSERLPKLGEKVLVSTKNTIFTQVFKRIYGTPDRWGWEHHTIKKVTAWMPLPEPYRKETEDETSD